jgi:hypothetical protein
MGPPGPSGPPPGPPPAREGPPGPPPRDEREYGPPPYGPPRPMGPIFSVKLIAILTIIGLILFYVGGIICIGSFNTDLQERDIDDVENAQVMYKVGLIILSVGGLLALIALVGGGILNTEINPQIRAAMISMGIALIVLIVVIALASPGTRSAV